MPNAITKTVSSGNIELATEFTGTPDKGTILLAMGATASMVWWPDILIEALAANGYQVIRFDHRDTGQSTTNAPGDLQYDVHDLAGDLIAILDAYEVPATHLVGMSLGGYVSQIDAIQHPERVLSLTLIAAEPLGINYPNEGIAAELIEHFGTIGELDWSDHDAVAKFLLRIAEISAGKARPFDRAAAMARIARELARTGSMQSAFNHAGVGGELSPSLKASNIKQPLLVIHGTEDPVISVEAARATVHAVPGAKLVMLEGAGHELVEADVPQIVAEILEHCARAAS